MMISQEHLKRMALEWLLTHETGAEDRDARSLVEDLIEPLIKAAVTDERKRALEVGKGEPCSDPKSLLEKAAIVCERIAENHWRRESYSHECVAMAMEEAANKIRGI